MATLSLLDSDALPQPWVIDGLVTHGDARRWAVLSPDGRYRYALAIVWDERPLFDVVMFNPSRADHQTDDNTFKKVRHFAIRHSCGGLLIRNLAALRATDPRQLWVDEAPVGPRNLDILSREVVGSTRVAAWGRLSPKSRQLFGASLAVARRYCTRALRVGEHGDPWHPLYLPNATSLVPFGRGAA